MPLSSWDGVFYGAIALGLVAAAWRLLSDAPGSDGEQQRQRLERQLARRPGSVLVRAQRQRAMKRYVPTFLFAVALAFIVPNGGRNGPPWLCEKLGAEGVRLLLLYGLPALLVAVAAAGVVKAVRVLKGGYSPPLDAVLMHDTVAVTGWRAKIDGLLGLVAMPAILGLAIYGSHFIASTYEGGQAVRGTRCSTPGTAR